MRSLDSLRDHLGFPFRVTSGHRCPKHNDFVSSTGLDGPHTKAQAADIAVYGSRALMLVSQAVRFGMTGVGLKQTGGAEGRFIHLDNLPSADKRARPWMWTY